MGEGDDRPLAEVVEVFQAFRDGVPSVFTSAERVDSFPPDYVVVGVKGGVTLIVTRSDLAPEEWFDLPRKIGGAVAVTDRPGRRPFPHRGHRPGRGRSARSVTFLLR